LQKVFKLTYNESYLGLWPLVSDTKDTSDTIAQTVGDPHSPECFVWVEKMVGTIMTMECKWTFQSKWQFYKYTKWFIVFAVFDTLSPILICCNGDLSNGHLSEITPAGGIDKFSLISPRMNKARGNFYNVWKARKMAKWWYVPLKVKNPVWALIYAIILWSQR
jgi:hypothetical protein